MKAPARLVSAASCLFFFLLFPCVSSALSRPSHSTLRSRSSLEITVHRAFLLVISPNGFETGYDPTVFGSFSQSIPNSHYSDIAVPTPSGRSNDTHATTIKIDLPIAGRYTVQAIGNLPGKFIAKFTATDERGKATSRIFRGTVWPGRTRIYFVDYSPAPGAKFSVTSLAPFSRFSATVNVVAIPPPSYHVIASFTLGSRAGGIDPLIQPVSFQLSNYAVTIPAGSFTRSKAGNYRFDGWIQNVHLRVRILPKGGNRFELAFTAQGISLETDNVPVWFLLILGSSAGVTRFQVRPGNL